jgi:hypothetical protein
MDEAAMMAAATAAAVALNERVRTAHERVPCPVCSAPVRQVCCRMPAGYPWGNSLKHPHDARLRADGILLR